MANLGIGENLLIGRRQTLMLVGMLGLPVVLSILWQSRILIDQSREDQKREAASRKPGFVADLRQLFSRSILMFFGFFMVSSMAGAGIQSWPATPVPAFGARLFRRRPSSLPATVLKLSSRAPLPCAAELK
jgi:hypothetical protein